MKKIFVIIPILSVLVFGKSTNDIIEPVTLFNGETKTILISDLFYSDNYDVRFIENDALAVQYDSFKRKIKLTPTKNDISFTCLKFVLNKDTLSIPVFIKENHPVVFRFPFTSNIHSVSVFGSFNDWNRKQYLLKKIGNYFETIVFIRPGNYQYKFFVDGKEYCDPENSDSVSNGMGGFNSVLEVKPLGKEKIFLHKKNYVAGAKNSKFSFIAETKSAFNENNVFAFLDNKLLYGNDITVNGKVIFVEINNDELIKAKRFRILIAKGNSVSNLQNVFLHQGKPAGVNSGFDWHEGIIYSLLIDRFYDGDKTNSIPLVHDSLFAKANYMGGDLLGIIDKIEAGYFDSLGINVLWISPVYDNPNKPYREYPAPHRWFSGYHGYWPINSFAVDEHFGTLNLLKQLVTKAHERGIKVLLDFVSNHVHIENPLYKQHRNWFGSLYLPDGRKNIRFWDEYRLTTWFEPYLPSFDYLGSDEAVEFMTDNALWWLNKSGADGFRHDAVKHVPNKFWRRLTEKLKQNGYENIYQIGETFGSDVLVSSYVNNGQLNAQFNFNLYNVALETFLDSSKSFKNLLNEINTTFSFYGENNLMGNIMDSHDKNRFMAFADGDLSLEQWSAVEEGWNNPPKVDFPSSYKKAVLYFAYMFSIPGIPVIYYGSEFGMSGASDPDNRRMMRFGKQLNTHEKNMLEETSRIVKLRRTHPALNFGDFFPLISKKSIFAFVRSDFNERILIVMNKNFVRTEKVSLNLPDVYSVKTMIDLSDNSKINVKNGKIELVLPPLSWKYFLLK